VFGLFQVENGDQLAWYQAAHHLLGRPAGGTCERSRWPVAWRAAPLLRQGAVRLGILTRNGRAGGRREFPWCLRLSILNKS